MLGAEVYWFAGGLLVGICSGLAWFWLSGYGKLRTFVGGQLRNLEESWTQGLISLHNRVEQLRGQILVEFLGSLHRELSELNLSLQAVLREGRQEQMVGLKAAVETLEQRFDSIKAAVGDGLQKIHLSATETGGQLVRTLTNQLEMVRETTVRYFEGLRQSVENQLEQIRQTVQARLDEQLREGFLHFERVQAYLKNAEAQLREVSRIGESVEELNRLLQLPYLRGRFGEVQLGRLVAEFLPAQAFSEQYEIVAGSGEKVDVAVFLAGYILPIDSKFNREQVRELFEASSPSEREGARRKLCQVIREQAREIARKYIHPEQGTTDLALMFLPSETIYQEVLQQQELYQNLCALKVYPVSPTTLVVVLQALALVLNQYRVASGIKRVLLEVQKAERHLCEFRRYFEQLGQGIGRVQLIYAQASSRLERCLQSLARLDDSSSALDNPSQQG